MQEKRICSLAISALLVYVRAQAGLEQGLASGREAGLYSHEDRIHRKRVKIAFSLRFATHARQRGTYVFVVPKARPMALEVQLDGFGEAACEPYTVQL